MRRRRPVAVYRVLDEEDLLSGTDYLDAASAPVEVWPAGEGAGGTAAGEPGGEGAGGTPAVEPGGAEMVVVRAGAVAGPALASAAAGADRRGAHRGGGPGRTETVSRTGMRVRALLVCATILLLVMLAARLASALLGGAGAARGARPPGGAPSGPQALDAGGNGSPPAAGVPRPAIGADVTGTAGAAAPETATPPPGIGAAAAGRPRPHAAPRRPAAVIAPRRTKARPGPSAPRTVPAASTPTPSGPRRPPARGDAGSRVRQQPGLARGGSGSPVAGDATRGRRPAGARSAPPEFGFER